MQKHRFGRKDTENNVWVACSWLEFEFLRVRGLVPNCLDSHCDAEMLEWNTLCQPVFSQAKSKARPSRRMESNLSHGYKSHV